VTAQAISEKKPTKCMQPNDARFLQPAMEVPDEWLEGRWHSGMSLTIEELAPQSNDQRHDIGFTTAGTRMWWTKTDNANETIYLETQDEEMILCADAENGIQVFFFQNNAGNRNEDWCKWTVDIHPDNSSTFRLRNFFFQQTLPEIGHLYFAKTGVYFDYDEASINHPENRVDEEQKWFRWVETDLDSNSVDFEDLVDDCSMLAESIVDFEEEGGEIGARSFGSGPRTVQVMARKNNGVMFIHKNKKYECKNGWYLFGDKCYRMLRRIFTTQIRAKRICKMLKGTAVMPKSKREQNFLNQFLLHYDRGQSYWIAAEAVDGTGKGGGSVKFHDGQENPLKFRRWIRNRGSFQNDKCAYLKNKRWYPAKCTSTHKVLCEIDAKPAGNVECGRIQDPEVDEIMKIAATPVVTKALKARIVNGDPAHPGQFPWQISIRFKRPLYSGKLAIEHNCGGSLIDECWVLSAAHCFPENKKKKYYVRVGDTNNDAEEGTEQDFDIDELIIHQDYKLYPSPRNDIALIKLKRNSNGKCATFNEAVQPACLPDDDFPMNEEGDLCQVSGWGVTNTSLGHSSAKPNLQWVTLPTLKTSYCNAKYNRATTYFLEEVMFCAGFKEGGKDACTGDSGGPYVCRNSKGKYAVTGVVSFGIGCARKKYPGVYTKVKSFNDWIRNTVNEYGDGRVIG